MPLASDLFQVNYKESTDQAAGRFRDWLEDCLVKGLETWRQASSSSVLEGIEPDAGV